MSLFYQDVDAGLKKAIEAFGTVSSLPVTIEPYWFKAFIGTGYKVESGGPGGFSLASYRSNTSSGYLTGATVTVEGDFGSLTRAEVNFTIARQVLDAVDKNFILGAVVLVQYGRGATNCTAHVMRLYDHSWTINPDDTVSCTIKAVGVGQQMFSKNMLAMDFPAGLQFRPNYADDGNFGGTQVFANVSNIVDFIDYEIQNKTGKTTADNFDPEEMTWPGEYFIRVPPAGVELFKSKYSMNQDIGMMGSYTPRGVYVTLSKIIWILNNYMIEKNKIVFGATATLNYTLSDGEKVCVPSANPIEMIFGYGAQFGQAVVYGPKGSTTGLKGGYTGAAYFALGSDTVVNWPNLHANLGDILINRDLIAAIFAETTGKQQDANEPTRYNFLMPLDTFLTKLFNTIKENSSGAIDLFAMPNETDNKLYIYNKRGYESPKKPWELKRGLVAIKSISIQSKVPSDAAAAAFGKPDAGQGNADDSKAATLIQGGDATAPATGYPSGQELYNAQGTAGTAGFTPETVNGIKGVVKRMISGEPPAETAKKTNIEWPLTLNLTLLGAVSSTNWKFGDTISYSDLPSKYKDAKGGVQIAFTVTRVNHKFDAEQWTTDITSQCRFAAEA